MKFYVHILNGVESKNPGLSAGSPSSFPPLLVPHPSDPLVLNPPEKEPDKQASVKEA